MVAASSSCGSRSNDAMAMPRRTTAARAVPVPTDDRSPVRRFGGVAGRGSSVVFPVEWPCAVRGFGVQGVGCCSRRMSSFLAGEIARRTEPKRHVKRPARCTGIGA